MYTLHDSDTCRLADLGVVHMRKQLGLNGAGITPANFQYTPFDASKGPFLQ
jgi:hypothetical protein